MRFRFHDVQTRLLVGEIRWYCVRPRFREFLENLKITEDQTNDRQNKHRGVVSCLKRGYWNGSDDAFY